MLALIIVVCLSQDVHLTQSRLATLTVSKSAAMHVTSSWHDYMRAAADLAYL